MAGAETVKSTQQRTSLEAAISGDIIGAVAKTE